MHDHGRGRHHDHHDHCDHGAHGHPTRRLPFAIALTSIIFLAELAGGIWSGSLALLADSLHVLFDATALALAWGAAVLAGRSATDRHSWGLHRSEILAALVNGTLLILVAGGIFAEGVRRLLHPSEVRAEGMLAVAVVGLVANAVVAWLLHAPQGDDLNVRGAYLHVLGDLLASVGVIAGALVIRFSNWTLVDPVLGMGIGLLLLAGAGKLVRESLHILMEGVPRGLTVEEVAAAVRGVAGVEDVHDVHVWSLCSHIRALSAHLLVDSANGHRPQDVIEAVNALLRERFRITHTTLQSECRACGDDGVICTPVHPGESPVSAHRH